MRRSRRRRRGDAGGGKGAEEWGWEWGWGWEERLLTGGGRVDALIREVPGKHSHGCRNITAHRSTAQHHSTTHHTAAQHSTSQHTTTHHTAAQHSTSQHTTTHHSTASQHGTAHAPRQHTSAHATRKKREWAAMNGNGSEREREPTRGVVCLLLGQRHFHRPPADLQTVESHQSRLRALGVLELHEAVAARSTCRGVRVRVQYRKHTTPQHSTAQHSTPHHTTPQHSTPQHSTPHNSTPHHTTTAHHKYSTAHHTHTTRTAQQRRMSGVVQRQGRRVRV